MAEKAPYYLVINRNGFEEPLMEGFREELEKERCRVETEEGADSARLTGPFRDRFYLVAKEEWDRQHCPLKPVDFEG